jgi:vancomycin resistance protein YoaR
MASRRYAIAARVPAVGRYRPTFSTPSHRRLFAAARTALAYVPFLLVLWVGLSVLAARGEALPGVHVGAVPVGGMDAVDARAAVARHYDAALGQPLRLVVDGRTWTPTAGELGFSVQFDGAIDDAIAYGREHEVLDGMLRAARLPEEAVVVPVNVAVDPAAFDAWLDRVERELGGAPVDAAVVIDGERIEATTAAAGDGIDRDAVRRAIAEQLVMSRPIAVETTRSPRQPDIATEEAVRATADVERLASEPLVLASGDETWELERATILSMIEVVPDAATPGALVVRPSAAAVDRVVAEIAGELDQDVRDARIRELDTHSKLVPSREGRTVDRAALSQALSQALVSGDRQIAIPLAATVEPKVTTDDVMRELGITDVIAVGDSNYAGSGSGRAHNVEQAARMIDGTLVEPGGTFSFNDAVGSLFSGEYRDAGSYIDGPGGQALGGGVCQVSTTVYRAVLAAGFPIVEWWPHFYRSPFYEQGGWEPGWDASITQFEADSVETSTDFRFDNPTDSWLLIRSSVTPDDELTVEIHGAPTGYDVWFDEPLVETVEWATDEVTITVDEELPPGTILPDQPAMDGLEVTVVRYVADADGEILSIDTFVSTYEAYGAVRRVSPDMEDDARD